MAVPNGSITLKSQQPLSELEQCHQHKTQILHKNSIVLAPCTGRNVSYFQNLAELLHNK